MSTPETAVKHYRAMLRLQRSARAAAAVAWSSLSAAYLSESWGSVSPALERAVSRLQLDAATRGAGYGARTLADQGLYEAPEAWVDPSSWLACLRVALRWVRPCIPLSHTRRT